MAIGTPTKLSLLLISLTCIAKSSDFAACVEQLSIPKYPELARRAKIEFEMTVTFTIDKRNRFSNMKVIPSRAIHSRMAELFEKAVIAVQSDLLFDERCVNKSMTIDFKFRIAGAGIEFQNKILNKYLQSRINFKDGLVTIVAEAAEMYAH
jgi:hypothetical protein